MYGICCQRRSLVRSSSAFADVGTQDEASLWSLSSPRPDSVGHSAAWKTGSNRCHKAGTGNSSDRLSASRWHSNWLCDKASGATPKHRAFMFHEVGLLTGNHSNDRYPAADRETVATGDLYRLTRIGSSSGYYLILRCFCLPSSSHCSHVTLNLVCCHCIPATRATAVLFRWTVHVAPHVMAKYDSK